MYIDDDDDDYNYNVEARHNNNNNRKRKKNQISRLGYRLEIKNSSVACPLLSVLVLLVHKALRSVSTSKIKHFFAFIFFFFT